MNINFGDYILNAYTITVTALIGAIGFLIRKIFTNEKQIEILESKLETMSKNIEDDIKDIKEDLRSLNVLIISNK